jgi:hypothetical protein
MLHTNLNGLTGEIATTSPGAEQRAAQRTGVTLGAGLRQRGASAVTVHIMDLSTTGFRASTHLELMTGTDLWLKLPGLESLQSRVVWMQGHMLGAEFVRPLHPAVLDMVVRNCRV